MSDNFTVIAREPLEDAAWRAPTPLVLVRVDYLRALLDWATEVHDDAIEERLEKEYDEGYADGLKATEE